MAHEDIGTAVMRDGIEMRLIAASQRGHVVSGQYLTLPRGDYTVDFKIALAIEAAPEERPCVVLDVVADWGNTCLSRVNLRVGDLSKAVKNIKLDFLVDDVATVEFRIEVMGACEVIVGTEPVLSYRYAPMVGYAHAREDIYLWRALAPRVHHSVGFWIDAGAFDPIDASVTKAFSDRGWRGINIEPLQRPYDRLKQQRPRDTNLQLLVSDNDGFETFFELDNGQLSTTSEEFARRHVEAGAVLKQYVVETTTLAKICETYAPSEIHFLKIDVEGHEAAAVRGMDFSRFRPWILILESTEPNRMDKPTHEEWEFMLLKGGYIFVRADLPNRYYVAQEHFELQAAFVLPADDYVPFRQLQSFRVAEEKIAALNDRINELQKQLVERSVAPVARKARWFSWR